MQSFGKSQAVRRTEDLRFLRGGGRYVDDIAPEGALHAAFVRSPVGHAELRGVDASDAAAMEGVACVLTAADLDGLDAVVDFYALDNADGSKAAAPVRPLLATGRVRFVGEPVALVVAATAGQARDAAEAVALDYEELPVHMAVAPGGEAIHDEAPGNVCFDWEAGDRAATDAAFGRAARTVRARIEDNRVMAASLEPRGAYAEWGADGRVHLCFNGQGVWGMKRELARVLGIDADRVRVTNPDVGGGFGMKAPAYPEYFAIAEASRRVGAPVRWMADRTEAMLADNGGRDLVSEAEMAFDGQNRLIGYRVDSVCNLGAYVSEYGQGVQTECFAKVLTAAYDVPAAHMRCRGVFTNTCQVDAYRGAGRPEAIYVIERMMDLAARELGVDPWELRRRNFVTAFPYVSATGETYDVGDFARVMDRVAREADAGALAARRAEAEGRGRLLGQGLCYYIESILGSPSEGGARGVRRGRARRAARRHAVERAGARDRLRAVPIGPHRHPDGPDRRGPGRFGRDRQGRRHGGLALGHDAGHGHARDGGGGAQRARGLPRRARGRGARGRLLRRRAVPRGRQQPRADDARGRRDGAGGGARGPAGPVRAHQAARTVLSQRRPPRGG